jgi:hypothetical protein
MKWPPRWALWTLFVLSGLLSPLIVVVMFADSVFASSALVRAQTGLFRLNWSLVDFHKMHQHWPVPSTHQPGQDFEGELTEEMRVLLDLPRTPHFADGPDWDEDTWHQRHRVLMDTNGDHKLPNPDARNTDPTIRAEAPKEQDLEVIVFSCGPDRKPYTADAVLPWRVPEPKPRPVLLLGLAVAVVMLFYSMAGLSLTRRRLALLENRSPSLLHDY